MYLCICVCVCGGKVGPLGLGKMGEGKGKGKGVWGVSGLRGLGGCLGFWMLIFFLVSPF